MIEEIAIENLGVIRRARVPLSPGLTVITGETGAGKTMLLTGLGLLMGGKADPAAVRSGETTAVAEGRFRVGDVPAALRRIDDAGGEIEEDGTVVVLRTVAAGGRSRAHLGGRGVPAAVLGDIAAELVTVHGQSEQVRLRSASRQRAALDAYAGPDHAELLRDYRAAWTQRAGLAAKIQEIETHAAERAREAEELRAGLAAVERVDPRPGEDAQLMALAARLANAEDLRLAAQVAHEAIAGDDERSGPGAAAACEQARRALEAAARTDPALAPLAERLADVGYALADIGTDIAGYADDLQADPAGLEAAHARLAELASLTRVRGGTIDEVLDWASAAGLRLLDLEDDGGRLGSLAAELAEVSARLADLAGQITASRSAAAAGLSAAVTAELRGLGMGGATLLITVDPAAEPGAWGADQVGFALVPHAGAPARPLGQGASGGELSRVMLAIEVALATAAAGEPAATGRAPLPTFVFDEVDAGVGGRAAVEVGRRLARLARTTQVVVVTHLAQVAAFADSQLVVTKDTPGEIADPDATGAAGADGVVGGTVTGVREVSGEDRVRELARMLSGAQDSAAARRHALELLESSAVGR